MEEKNKNPRIEYVMRNTRVVRPPLQTLATFGSTVVRYHMVSVPVYADLPQAGSAEESVIRNGTVRADRPQVVTPYYLSRTDGFGKNAEEFLEQITAMYGANAPGLLYTYKNEFGSTEIVSGNADEVSGRIQDRLDREDRRLEAVIRGVDDHWDLSLLKFIFDLTNRSVERNVGDLNSRGLLDTRDGAPRDAHMRIERMLEEARRGERDPSEVHAELERWGLFEQYEDRFLALFRR
jgi:hypothetical protein